jgi:6-pyruvoyl-tetrahydropterin synthase
MILNRQFRFEAAHRLPRYHGQEESSVAYRGE